MPGKVGVLGGVPRGSSGGTAQGGLNIRIRTMSAVYDSGDRKLLATRDIRAETGSSCKNQVIALLQ